METELIVRFEDGEIEAVYGVPEETTEYVKLSVDMMAEIQAYIDKFRGRKDSDCPKGF